MLRELITWVLNTYLGKYLENFNSAQISVALLSGEVELENVPIRKDALRLLGIPMQVFSGSIGRIKLKVPVRNLRTSPWSVSIERLYCVIGPKDLDDWDDTKERNAEHDYKLSALEDMETKFMSEKGYQTQTYYSSSYNAWLNFGTNIVANIIENIELKIVDVHFRYENNATTSDSFSVGIKINSLTAQSCDSNWNAGANRTASQDVSFKIIELADFCLYWDRLQEETICKRLSNVELLQNMKNVCSIYEHRFVINPISAKAQWRREKNDKIIRSLSKPTVSCEILVPEVKVAYSSLQHNEFLNCLCKLRKIRELRSYRLKRPKTSVAENAKLWWKFATNCYGFVYHTENEKWQILKQNLQYMRICRRLLLNPNENLSKDDKTFKSNFETERDLAELKLLRNICMENLFSKGMSLKPRNIPKSGNMLFHWFPNWMGWYGNSTVQSTDQDDSFKTLEDDILNALENTIEDNNTLSKCESMFGYCKIILIDGEVILTSDENANVNKPQNANMLMQFKNLSAFMQTNSLFTSYVFGISLDSICLIEKVTEHTIFPCLIKPQIDEKATVSKSYFDIKNIFTKSVVTSEPFFQLQYECTDETECRLSIKSKSLDIIYNQEAFKWLIRFFTKPYISQNLKYQPLTADNSFKKTAFLKNWKEMIIGYKETRKIWSFEIEIFAPRIIFMEDFSDNNTLMILMDFGKFQLLKNDYRKKKTNSILPVLPAMNEPQTQESLDEEELYMTPCSTPPGSQKTNIGSPTLNIDSLFPDNIFINQDTELQSAFHNKLYDKYMIHLTDLQVLVCKNQERWQASLKNSSNFHLLDKFNISLSIEQRTVFTIDPEYPSVTLFGTLSKILIHANEQKLISFCNIMYPITKQSLFEKPDKKEQKSQTIEGVNNVTGSFAVVQFFIEQVILEIQSNEKSIAELQIIGARAGINKRLGETHFTMSVHGLLLVDAIQSFGPDFELLAASHRHVGMDNMSGSLKHSAPCSPVSPGSPDSFQRPTSPNTINKVLNNIDVSTNSFSCRTDDSSALISLEIYNIPTDDQNLIQITNIAFNNLDIIVNQQTIIELMNFGKRVVFDHVMFKQNINSGPSTDIEKGNKVDQKEVCFQSREINFDFYRLNILLLHTIKRGNYLVARKVGTLTMSEAKIQAVLKKDVHVTGSLGGIQIIDITPEGINHQRIFSVGKDPLTDPPILNKSALVSKLTSEMYSANETDEYDQLNALNFKFSWNKQTQFNIKIRMASVWYTHCPRFLKDVNICVTQFQKSFKKFLTSIRNKATDMAKEIVHQLTDRNLQTKLIANDSPQYAIDVIISSPVIVLPVSNESLDVLVANLGKITVYNKELQPADVENPIDRNMSELDENVVLTEQYNVEIRNINLFSLNIMERKEMRMTALPKANEFYSCKDNAFAILHDTAIFLKIFRGFEKNDNILCYKHKNICWIEGSVTEVLKISLSKDQYKQLINSIESATNFSEQYGSSSAKTDIVELNSEESRGKVLDEKVKTTVKFSVPIFQIDLQNEFHDTMINVEFHEFSMISHAKNFKKEMQIFLRSVLMEDLKSKIDSPFRKMITSSNLGNELKRNRTSSSCPNFCKLNYQKSKSSASMPSKLDCCSEFADLLAFSKEKNFNSFGGFKDKLVVYKSRSTVSHHANNPSEVITSSTLEFNCLNLAISVDRWFLIFDFFGLVSDDKKSTEEKHRLQPNEKGSQKHSNQLVVSVRSLNVTLIRNEIELAKVNVSNAIFTIHKNEILKSVEGSLGSISLYDLTDFGHFYKQKFITVGSEAFSFLYKRIHDNNNDPNHKQNPLAKDALLHIKMSSAIYIHTKRFSVEMHLFIKELLQLQTPVIEKLKHVNVGIEPGSKPSQIGLHIQADSPVIMLPAAYNCNQILVANLGKLTLKNEFYWSNDEFVISKKRNTTGKEEILDVMSVDLININLFAGELILEECNPKMHEYESMNISNLNIYKSGDSFFKEACHLNLQIERNTNTDVSHNCPDLSIKANFSKLKVSLDKGNYKLIRGLLSYNLGEEINDVHYNYSYNLCESMEKLNSLSRMSKKKTVIDIWNVMSINVLLEDVSILLAEPDAQKLDIKPLSCIHFIKSTLEIDTFSDNSQDIDLISSNILVIDAREGLNETNTFKNILEPSKRDNNSNDCLVQAEIHCRKRLGNVKYTIMLNNMRLILMMSYLESLNQFLKEEPTPPKLCFNPFTNEPKPTKTPHDVDNNDESVEIVLNITDSEIILIEDFSRLDTNAIILKSTTVISYKPINNLNPLSVNINHLEIFSCTLDAEEESALSIIDPCTLNIELRNNCINFVLQKQLNIRLSYNDIKLFARMLHIIPTQSLTSKTKRNSADLEVIAPLIAMGFDLNDSLYAMELNNYKINDAAIWLSQQKHVAREKSPLNIKSFLVNASCISVCIIDDCMDADVPLLEFLFSHMTIKYKLLNKHTISETPGKIAIVDGTVDTELTINYYNRRLSGWEPIVELWECSSIWSLTKNESSAKYLTNVRVSSKQLLKLNITSTLVELFNIVQKNWIRDYYDCSPSSEMPNGGKLNCMKRRSPFVPFALLNLTGTPLSFKPIYAQPGGLTCTEVNEQELLRNWLFVQPNSTVPFEFSHKTKLRHLDSHKLNLHQIMVQINGWTLIGPISIDKVGIFFRYSSLECQYSKKTRIVFDISLIGSAQKLITVRSALTIWNRLDRQISLKMKCKDDFQTTTTSIIAINPDVNYSVPLQYVDSAIYIKHNATQANEKSHQTESDEETGFGTREILWSDCNNDSLQALYTSYDVNRATVYTLVDINKDKFPTRDFNIVGHTITLLAPLKINNMLCCDLIYRINNDIHGRINCSDAVSIYKINISESINFSITLDNYQLSGQLKIPMGHNGTVEPKLKLVDLHKREIFLRVSIQSCQGKGMEIYVSAPIWIINKTGLPLIYKQEGTVNEASGQFEDNEGARQLSPLMFSFSDQEGSPALKIRLGKSFGNNNLWCKSFGLHKNTVYRNLKSEESRVSFEIGINVRRGRGIYACTAFVTISPRFQIHNRTGYKLEFAQQCDISKFGYTNGYNIISAPVDSNFPFHWPNCDHEPLLCVRIAEMELCCWSKGIPINEVQSLYINIRNELSEMCFLRLEIIANTATYILLFTDARSLPPPIRVDNYSEVCINFSQYMSKPMWLTSVRPQSSIAYVLDDPLGSQSLLIEAPGGDTIDYAINKYELTKSLSYANFIYIAFRHTFCRQSCEDCKLNLATHELVLGVKDRKVVIVKKNSGDRSQLWLMNSNGQLEHEGSSPPSQRSDVNAIRLVLDLEKPPNPTDYTNLVVRPLNKQRITTQTWRFQGNRLMCHANMCVQSRDGLCGLHPGCEAVLGKINSKPWASDADSIPLEQCIVTQKLRPGSGQLEVTSKMDGPISTIQIWDMKNRLDSISLAPDPHWKHASIVNNINVDEEKKKTVKEYSIHVTLPKGVGVSIITRKPCEELAYVTLEDISADIFVTPYEKSTDLNISYIQIDNQLLDTTCPIAFFTQKITDEESVKSSLLVRVRVLPSPNQNTVIIKHLLFELKPCNVYLDEKLILKMAQFLRFGNVNKHKTVQLRESNLGGLDKDHLLTNTVRYYFENLTIAQTQIRLSVITSTKLPYDLLETKKALGLTLIKFEDAMIDFDKFSDKHHFETIDVYLRAIRIHYINQIKWHAASILGSVDFLGNPLGFANDLSEGVSGLIFEGSVKSLVKNVTHGISNSTAKLTETLSDSLGRVVLDDHDNETRQRILELQSHTSGGHLAAGLKGFGFGLLGGVTSIVRHTYDGVQSDGVPGFLSGLGKGLVGTVTKPIIGVLDLASETANAVRETSRGSHRNSPSRKRLPRCVTGAPGDLLPQYSFRQSKGQQYLYAINRRNLSEKLISYEPHLWSDKDARLRLLVSTEYIRIFSLCEGTPAIMFECHISEILSCHPLVTSSGSSASAGKVVNIFYIEISTNLPKITRPRIRCHSEQIAEEASRCINYAKNVYDEQEHSLLYL